MKNVLRIMLCLIVLMSAVPVALAQTEGNRLEYGGTATGEITNQTFEVIFTFEGAAGDIVVIEMISRETYELDAYLYLTTLENEVLAQNDDYYDLNARVIARLPADGEYQIVATRNGGRSGSGQGAFTLHLNSLPPAKPGITLEGTATVGDAPPAHVFLPEAAGRYTVTYTLVRGDYFPALRISRLVEGNYYEEEIAMLSGGTLHGGSLTLEFELGVIYIFSLQNSYYNYGNTGANSVYTLRLEAVEPAE